jgi:hypothetical protein
MDYVDDLYFFEEQMVRYENDLNKYGVFMQKLPVKDRN